MDHASSMRFRAWRLRCNGIRREEFYFRLHERNGLHIGQFRFGNERLQLGRISHDIRHLSHTRRFDHSRLRRHIRNTGHQRLKQHERCHHGNRLFVGRIGIDVGLIFQFDA
jgi:hypothetical protein